MNDARLWSIDGVAYDLEPFVRSHPGGAALLRQTQGQDVSTQFHTRHRDAGRLAPLLSRFAVAGNAKLERPFRDGVGFLSALHGRLDEPRWRESVAWSDIGFAVALATLCGFYALFQWRALVGDVKLLPYAVLLAPVRIWLAAFGKSFRFRRVSFTNVVLSYLVELDYRRRVGFDAERFPRRVDRWAQLPRGYRIPIDIFSTLLFPLEACLTLCRLGRRFLKQPTIYSFSQLVGSFLVRSLLAGELWYFVAVQRVQFWVMQWLLTCVVSCLLEICSPVSHAASSADWPLGVIDSVVDVVLSGNPYLDSVLTAGLSCERMRRLLPFQWSPFAHVATEALAKEIAEEKKIPWPAPTHLITHRLPSAIRTYLLRPSITQPPPPSLWGEHFSRKSLHSAILFLWESLFPMSATSKGPSKRD